MDLVKAKYGIRQVLGLIERWESAAGEPSAIERDLVLQKLRETYDELLQLPVLAESEEQAVAAGVAVASVEPDCEYNTDCEEDECTVELIFSDEDDEEPLEEEIAEEAEPETAFVPELEIEPESEPTVETDSVSEPDPELVIEAEQEPAPEEKNVPVADETPQPSLFGDEIPVRRPVRRSVIMSLYDEEEHEPVRKPVLQPVKTEPEPEDESVDEAPVLPLVPEMDAVLGDVLGADRQTIGDTIPRREDLSSSAPLESLRSAIGVNDRFLLVRDLFDGDQRAYEAAIDALEAQPTLDDCMIYIVEHYTWRSDSAGATLIMELLQRKYR